MTILESAPAGEESVTVDSRCFATFAQAFEYGSASAIQVRRDLQPNEVTQSLARAASTSASYVLGTYYDQTNYTGQTWQYWGNASCTSTSGYNLATLSTGWGGADNRFESSESHSNCDENRLYEHQYYGGAVRLCTPDCNDLGASTTIPRH